MSIEDVCSALLKLKGKILILSHHNADVDAVCSVIALHLILKKMGIDSKLGVSESISKTARKISHSYDFLIDPDCKEFDSVILVDSSVPEQLASVPNLHIEIVIDHHVPGELIKNSVSFIDENSKSSSQLIYKIAKKLGVEIDRSLAKILLAGIIYDSAHLRLADLETLEIVVDLLKKGVSMEEVVSEIKREVDVSEAMACLKAAKRLSVYKLGDLIIVFSHVVSHEAAACRALIRLGASISVVIAKKKQELRISSRGRHEILKKNIDLSEVFKRVGKAIGGSGGGHALAGSANGKNKKTLSFIINFIIREIERQVGKKIEK
jgi:nanoRNase/pAp phosphatase (c-di-AMP/oligoRNAs hydrolase)